MSPKHLFILLTAFFPVVCGLAQNSKADSLKKALLAATTDTSRVNALNALAWELSNSNPDTFRLLIAQAISLAGKTDHKRGLVNALRYKGVFNYNKGNYPEALDNFNAALNIARKLDDNTAIAKILSNMGVVYVDQADYPKALEHYFKALTIAEKLGIKQLQAITLGNIGNVYGNQADYPKALDYYFRSLKMKEELDNKTEIATTLGNIGVVYHNQGNYPKSLEYCFRALKISEELDDKYGMARHLGNIGNTYNEQGDYPHALDYYSMALKMNEKLDNKDEMAIWLGNIGSLYTKTRQFNDAELYLSKSLALYKEIGVLDGTRDFEKMYSRLDSARGNFKGALEHYKQHIAARDSITNEENTKKQTQQEMQYEFDKKESRTRAEQEKKNAVTRIILWSVSSGLVLVLLLAVFIFRGYRQKQKAHLIITAQKAEVERQKRMVEVKQKEILDSIHYARRIQNAILPSAYYIQRNLEKLIRK